MRDRLILWDIDYTLVNAGGQSRRLYREVFHELYGRELAAVAPMAGRTDRAIILATLGGAGVADPAGQVCAFTAGLRAHAAEFAGRVRAHGHTLPGAVEALRALAALDAAPGPESAPLSAGPTPPAAGRPAGPTPPAAGPTPPAAGRVVGLARVSDDLGPC